MGKLFTKMSFAAALVAVSLCAGQAAATVYSFAFATTGAYDGGFTGSFTASLDDTDFHLNEFATWTPGDVAVISGADLTCKANYLGAAATCDRIILTRNVDTGSGQLTDEIAFFIVERPDDPYHFYFDAGAFMSSAPATALDITGLVDADGHLPPAAASLNAAVPEPTTWAMLILGFSALGAVLRHQRRRLVRAIA